jgi:S1 RNA binding domain protein
MEFEIGAIYKGKVTGIMDYGAFVDCGEGRVGMIHISEVAPVYVTSIRDHLQVGQEVSVKVVGVNEKGKVSLSIKKAMASADAAAPRRDTAVQAPPHDVPSPPPPRSDAPRPARRSAPNVWQGPKSKRGEGAPSFEDMMSRFKQSSEDKISTLRKSGDSRYAPGGSSRRKK